MAVLDRLSPGWSLPAAALVLALFLLPTTAYSASEVFPFDDGSTCLDCHDDLLAKSQKHGAIEDSDSCILCHPLADPAQHTPTRPGKNVAELCLQCHDAFQGRRSTHGPVAAGECTACHDPHSADQPKLLRQAQPELCFTCHDKVVEDPQKIKLQPMKQLFEDDQAVLHPPFAEGCGDCHQSHASDQPRLLKAAYPTGFYQSYSEAAYGLCLNCHEAEAFSQPRTQKATAFRNGDLNLHYRHVNKDKGRSCRACHSPHGSYQPHLMAASFRFGERILGLTYEATDNGGSCSTSCHVKVSYDRLEPVNNRLRTSPVPGQDAGQSK